MVMLREKKLFVLSFEKLKSDPKVGRRAEAGARLWCKESVSGMNLQDGLLWAAKTWLGVVMTPLLAFCPICVSCNCAKVMYVPGTKNLQCNDLAQSILYNCNVSSIIYLVQSIFYNVPVIHAISAQYARHATVPGWRYMQSQEGLCYNSHKFAKSQQQNVNNTIQGIYVASTLSIISLIMFMKGGLPQVGRDV